MPFGEDFHSASESVPPLGGQCGILTVTTSIDRVVCVRLRLPNVQTRGSDAEQRPVRNDQEPQPGRRARRGRTAAGRLAAADAGVAGRGGRLARLARRWSWLPGWVFAAVTQAPALLAIAWLVPGFAMLLAGRLLPRPMLIIFVPLVVALCYFAMRRLPV